MSKLTVIKRSNLLSALERVEKKERGIVVDDRPINNQFDLAKAFGVSRSYISQLKRKTPEVRKKLHDAAGNLAKSKNKKVHRRTRQQVVFSSRSSHGFSLFRFRLLESSSS
jgi:transposase